MKKEIEVNARTLDDDSLKEISKKLGFKKTF